MATICTKHVAVRTKKRDGGVISYPIIEEKGVTYKAGRSKYGQYPHFYYNTLAQHLEQCLLKGR